MSTAKKVKARVSFHVIAGGATPVKVGSSLGPLGVNSGAFCKQFNDATEAYKGAPLPTYITVYEDRSFEFKTKQPTISHLIKKVLGIKSGANNPGKEVVSTATEDQVAEVANLKMLDLNVFGDEEAAKNIVRGSMRSMGILISSDSNV